MDTQFEAGDVVHDRTTGEDAMVLETLPHDHTLDGGPSVVVEPLETSSGEVAHVAPDRLEITEPHEPIDDEITTPLSVFIGD